MQRHIVRAPERSTTWRAQNLLAILSVVKAFLGRASLCYLGQSIIIGLRVYMATVLY
ncbi:hypothetical protein K523DRAFT_322897 [Schizophyllum commune Tattone D]|nr:hypothetical protein K523DRAFT_322897 [Schizophyllum commune Tattone D]